MQKKKQALQALIVAVVWAGTGAPASADLVATLAGNDCAGVFGTSFSDCRVASQYDPNQSPVIAKFDIGSGWEFNAALFPGVTADDFSIVFDAAGNGSFTYFPDAGDPLITFYVAKGSNSFNLFSNDGDPNSGIFFTPVNGGGQSSGLSHISFYDTGDEGGGGPPQEIAEPGTLALLGVALTGAAWSRRRRRR